MFFCFSLQAEAEEVGESDDALPLHRRATYLCVRYRGFWIRIIFGMIHGIETDCDVTLQLPKIALDTKMFCG
jgi:hypothetical protein